jgi:hypothetical protein
MTVWIMNAAERAQLAFGYARQHDYAPYNKDQLWGMLNRAYKSDFIPEADLLMLENLENKYGILPEATGSYSSLM